MGELVKIKVDNTEIWMETEKTTAERVPQKVSKEQVAKSALKAGESLLETIKGYCSSLVKAFESLEGRKPNRITAEFGLKLSGNCKVYIVNSAGEASLKITAQWELHD